MEMKVMNRLTGDRAAIGNDTITIRKAHFTGQPGNQSIDMANNAGSILC